MRQYSIAYHRDATTVVGWLFLTAVVYSFPSADGAKILFVPGNVNSHVMFFSRFADDLARLGHVTEILVPSNARRPDFVPAATDHASTSVHPNFTYSVFPVSAEIPFSNTREVGEVYIRLALSKSMFESLRISLPFASRIHMWEEDCRQMLENDQLMERLREARFDFAVIDPVPVYMHCIYVLPYLLQIPYATLSVSTAPACSWLYRVPRLSSFVSAFVYTDRMSFFERLQTFVADMALLTIYNSSTYYVEKYAPDQPALTGVQFAQRSSLWFYLEDPAVGYAVPQMPNTLFVGDIMAGRQGKPLQAELEQFVAFATNGVVVVSFGSFFDLIPDDAAAKFCDAFKSLGPTGRRVVWKSGHSEHCAGVKNVHIMKWIPQNDLLADDRVKLFISHAGYNSVIEAAYHAKPAIFFPISYDQPVNAAAVEHKGFAIRMDIGDFTVDSLLEAIDRIFTEPSFQEKARMTSSLMRERKETAAERMSHMIEHVLKHGDQHLRTGAYELNVFQFMMFDIFAAIIFAAFLCIAIAFCCLRCCCQRCRRRVCSKNLDQKRKSD